MAVGESSVVEVCPVLEYMVSGWRSVRAVLLKCVLNWTCGIRVAVGESIVVDVCPELEYVVSGWRSVRAVLFKCVLNWTMWYQGGGR